MPDETSGLHGSPIVSPKPTSSFHSQLSARPRKVPTKYFLRKAGLRFGLELS